MSDVTAAPPPSKPNAGWYPDPSGQPGVERYFDGSAWSSHQDASQGPLIPVAVVQGQQNL
jgi:hypothetical protein